MNTYYDYLFSTAYIETALSKLLEAQAKKIKFLSEKGLSTERISEMNKTLKVQLKKLEYLYLLLYNKTELLLEALEIQDQAEAFSGDICCYKTNPVKNTNGYILTCKGQNTVSNSHDPYRDGYAVLNTYSFIPKPKKENFLSYNVTKGSKILDLFSIHTDMETEITFGAGHVSAKIKGIGSCLIRDNGKHDCFQTCGYVLDIISDDITFANTLYKMKIYAVDSGIVLHDSGLCENSSATISKCR